MGWPGLGGSSRSWGTQPTAGSKAAQAAAAKRRMASRAEASLQGWPAKGSWRAGSKRTAMSVPQHHTFAPRVGATKPAVFCALDGLQAAGKVLLAHFVATGLEGFYCCGCKALFF